jgi:hypothetical protein
VLFVCVCVCVLCVLCVLCVCVCVFATSYEGREATHVLFVCALCVGVGVRR